MVNVKVKDIKFARLPSHPIKHQHVVRKDVREFSIQTKSRRHTAH